MDRTPESFAEALASGDTGRVNEAIDTIEAVDSAVRAEQYAALFDACYPVYESDDGYVRQSVVRFLRDAYPMLELTIAASETERIDGYTIDDLRENRTRLVEFLLEALEDDDGRVRTAAVDGFDTLGVAIDLAEIDAEKQVLLEELDDRTSDLPEEKAKHVEEAKRSVARMDLVGSLVADLDLDVP
ncbi:hypothetical protein HZS55_02105 [Halosimplex rubrum]|uniref:HEAT repeat domain-containing protein n=1 Tax=Halosimplex rubrum TaxID=869889 RepID=A0A7D5T3I8_9EURY|nr:hypothetical protein [Halosimplex rubrum]QLH76169.1 hypothetical protein HZS55_02105 [Halosimplex rubrum]